MAPVDRPRRRPFRLAHKLLLAKLATTALLLCLLLLYVGPATQRDFERQSEALLQQSVQATGNLLREQTDGSRAMLADLIAHTTEARRRALQDLPLGLYADDGAALATAVQQDDERRGKRLQANATALGQEMQRRADARIDQLLADLRQRQAGMAAGFAAELRTTHLWLCAGVMLGGLLVLFLGLYRVVVRPAELLRTAVRAVADGDLATTVPLHSSDELGALAADFAAMLRQLQQSRTALQRLTTDLEAEVAQKTEHLQRALTDLQRTHKELLQAEKMASIGTLAGGMAHEFHNLIGGIRGCATELQQDERDPDRRETLAVVLRAADRATAVTQQLLRFARPSVQRRGEVDLGAVLGEALRLCEPEARRRHVDIDRDLPAGLRVHGDADALHQVFVNLLTNALQAMPDGGRLQAEVQRVGTDVVATVRDSGHGIAAHDLDHVFEPFFTRKDQAKDPGQGGTGLGLSVSYGIVDAHGGRITVQSEVGRGSAFAVVLPALPVPAG